MPRDEKVVHTRQQERAGTEKSLLILAYRLPRGQQNCLIRGSLRVSTCQAMHYTANKSLDRGERVVLIAIRYRNPGVVVRISARRSGCRSQASIFDPAGQVR